MIQVIIFTMPTCAPCNALKKEIQGHNFDPTEVSFSFVDMMNPSDEDVGLASYYNVRSAPTVVILDKNNKPHYNGTMVKTLDRLLENIEEAKSKK